MENKERKDDIIFNEISDDDFEKLCIDFDQITISVNRFEELIKAEVSLNIIRRAYETSKSYELQDRLSFLFGPLPQPEKGDNNA